MKNVLFVLLALALIGAGVAVFSALASAPDAKPPAAGKPDAAALRAGHNFIPTPPAATEE
jgi:hypothetical protein